jgi:hypothetical protein
MTSGVEEKESFVWYHAHPWARPKTSMSYDLARRRDCEMSIQSWIHYVESKTINISASCTITTQATNTDSIRTVYDVTASWGVVGVGVR